MMTVVYVQVLLTQRYLHEILYAAPNQRIAQPDLLPRCSGPRPLRPYAHIFLSIAHGVPEYGKYTRTVQYW